MTSFFDCRLIQELKKLISFSGTPTVVWRRTGEICHAGAEFYALTEWTEAELMSGKKYIYEVRLILSPSVSAVLKLTIVIPIFDSCLKTSLLWSTGKNSQCTRLRIRRSPCIRIVCCLSRQANLYRVRSVFRSEGIFSICRVLSLVCTYSSRVNNGLINNDGLGQWLPLL